MIVAGANYGQGSSREQAALFDRYLGLEVVIAKSIARSHWQNLVNFGVLPLTFADPSDYDRLKRGDTIQIVGIADALRAGHEIRAEVEGSDKPIRLRHTLSERQIDVLLAVVRSIGGVDAKASSGKLKDPAFFRRRSLRPIHRCSSHCLDVIRLPFSIACSGLGATRLRRQTGAIGIGFG